MPTIKSNPITIIDSSANINLELFVSSNLPFTQILNHDNTSSPSWTDTPLVLTPSVYVSNTLLASPSISWLKRSGAGSYTSLGTGETVTNGVLTVNQNVLTSDPSKIITYKCTVTYQAISRSVELTYSLNVIGADGRDGSSVSILGTAYTVEEIVSCVVGRNYTLYTDVAHTTQITSPSLGDAYLVSGYLFVYSGAANSQFNCVGNIQGVSITSITGPVSNGVVDTYTIHYSDGETSTYTVINGKSVFITYNDGASTPSSPTGNGTSGGWHTNMTSAVVWMSQRVGEDVEWGPPIKIKGVDGKGIVSSTVSYQTSISGSSVPTGTWVTNVPNVATGQYLWTRTVITYTDNATTTGYTVGRVGSDGHSGSPGRGISSTNISYKSHTSGTVVPTGSWMPSVPFVAENQYLWTKTEITYTDNTTSTSYSVGKMGVSGVDGISIILTTDSYTFAGSTSSALAATVNCNVVAYKGTTRVSSTIGTITGVPSGMTTTVYQNGTTSAYFSIAVTTSMRTASGYLTVPVTVNGSTVNKIFSYSIAFKGATGASSVSFSIYSDTGLVFHNEDSITLKLQKLYGATNIAISGATTLQWSKFVNGSWTNTWKYDSGDANNVAATGETLMVKRGEVNGAQLYKCTLTYGGKAYTDTITITDKTDTYQSRIISIGGNVLHGGSNGLTAYAALFQGATEEDALVCPIYSQDTTPVANQIYYVLDGDNYVTKKYVNNVWALDGTLQQSHIYTWVILDKYTGETQDIGTGKVVYISGDAIERSGIVQCKISDVSVCTETFTDTNDPIISATEPTSNTIGQLWLNTTDNLLYAYKDGDWNPVNSGQNRTYVSAPITFIDCCYYKTGDLWIVGENDSAYTDFKAGTLLVATRALRDGANGWSVATWKDRLANDWDNKLYYDAEIDKITTYQDKLSAYVSFESDGMKIGATNTEFYTKVTPYDLGFYQGVEKVAYVSNNKMYNTSLEVSDGVQIVNHKSNAQPSPQSPSFMLGNYKFIVESNNSMSISYSLISAPQPSINRYAYAILDVAIYFSPWSTNNAYGYTSAYDTTAINNIKVYNESGTEIPVTITNVNGYIRCASTTELPSTVVIRVPEHVVYNKGVSGNTIGYDLTDVGNDAITLTLNRI